LRGSVVFRHKKGRFMDISMKRPHLTALLLTEKFYYSPTSVYSCGLEMPTVTVLAW